LFALLGKYYNVEVGTPFIAAILTIMGYSINDTIVVLDRVRENFPTHLKEYLQEEIKLLPTRSEANRFYEEVRRLRDCVERLEQEV